MTDICNYGSGMELKQNDFTFGGIAKGKIIIDVNLIKGAGLYKNVVLNGSLNLPFSGDFFIENKVFNDGFNDSFTQIAYPANGGAQMATRVFKDGVFSDWAITGDSGSDCCYDDNTVVSLVSGELGGHNRVKVYIGDSGNISGWVKLEMFSQFDNNNTIGAYGKMFDHAAIGNVFYANGSRVMYAMDRTTDYFKFGDKIEYDGRYFVWLYSLVAWALPNAFIIKATVFSWYNDVNFLPVLGEQEVYTGSMIPDIDSHFSLQDRKRLDLSLKYTQDIGIQNSSPINYAQQVRFDYNAFGTGLRGTVYNFSGITPNTAPLEFFGEYSKGRDFYARTYNSDTDETNLPVRFWTNFDFEPSVVDENVDEQAYIRPYVELQRFVFLRKIDVGNHSIIIGTGRRNGQVMNIYPDKQTTSLLSLFLPSGADFVFSTGSNPSATTVQLPSGYGIRLVWSELFGVKKWIAKEIFLLF